MRPLRKEAVKALLAQSSDPAEFIIGLYKLVIKSFNACRKLHGFPAVSRNTAKDILELGREKFGNDIAFLWLNNGFSIDYDLPDWVVDLSDLVGKVEY